MPINSHVQSHITKFSAKPPGYDAARQRENQRRHRARVKGKMSDLEAALASTQAELEAALRQVEHLTAEVDKLRSLVPMSIDCQRTSTTRLDELVTHPVDPELPGPHNSPTDTHTLSEEAPTLPIPRAERKTCAQDQQTSCSSEPTATGTPETVLLSSIEDPDSDCPLLPPPLPGESTITCRDAYKIIKDRNALSDTDSIDSETMNGWLKPGYRRAIIPGSGCRVETHVLFDFIDHITSN